MVRRLLGADLLDEAVAELEHEATYYGQHGGASVRNAFLDEVAQVARRVVEHPRSFPEWQRRPGIRRAVLDRFPFIIVFAVGPAGAESPLIVAFAHGKRRPGYWLALKRRRKAKRGSSS
ncbi:MAG: type II toxin-antitoxin system RelE/ParE family toxin [Polyangiaceae bacterium]